MKPEFKERIRNQYREYLQTMSPGAAKKRILKAQINLAEIITWRQLCRVLYRENNKHSENGKV